MSRNTFGRLFTVTTFGESHGPAIGCVIDGCPPGLAIEVADFRSDLDRRATGRSRHTSQRHETDEVEILSGVYDGQTTGTPIALLIRNTDAKPRDYDRIAEQFRPGHADYTYWRKYGIRDPRGGGRSSARETTMRVAAAVVARKWLKQHYGVAIAAHVAQVGPIHAENIDAAFAADNAIGWPDPESFAQVENFLDSLRRSGDSVGSRIDVVARGVPVGWGEPVYGKLDAELAAALMSINAVKGVEIGAGFAAVEQLGTEHRGEFHADGFVGNEAGGILGGIATGQDITARVAFKPASSLRLPVASVDQAGKAVEVVTTGRHDPCVGLRAPVIVEAMVALVLIDQALRHRAQCGDVRHEQPPIPPSRSADGADT